MSEPIWSWCVIHKFLIWFLANPKMIGGGKWNGWMVKLLMPHAAWGQRARAITVRECSAGEFVSGRSRSVAVVGDDTDDVLLKLGQVRQNYLSTVHVHVLLSQQVRRTVVIDLYTDKQRRHFQSLFVLFCFLPLRLLSMLLCYIGGLALW